MHEYRFLRFPGGKPKAVTFSYDDGPKFDLRLAEIFDRYGMKATFNLAAVALDAERSDWHMTAKEVQEHILAKGHEIAVHGEHHLAPGKLRPVDGIREFLNCRIRLEQTFGRIIRGAAYPNSGIRQMDTGNSYEKVRSYLADLDFAYARTLAGDNDAFRLPEDFLAWMPSAHHDNPAVFSYIEKFKNAGYGPDVYGDSRYPRLLYIWGHSFEFENNGNWDRIEKICQALAGMEDTYYATNIEICDYITAQRALILSQDQKTIFNPSAISVWISSDGSAIEIKSGESVRL